MFRNVIVGVDEHQGGHDAIALAKDLMAADGQLTLAYVHFGDPEAVRGAAGAFSDAERRRGLELLERARERSGVQARLLCTGSSSVGRGLHELAELQHADLLVVGSCRRGLIGRVLVADHTRDALNGAPCAVGVAPGGYAERPAVMREIGVAYNGSPESEHALAVARQIAAANGAAVSAFEAISLPTYLFGGESEKVDESIEEFVEDARMRIAKLGDVEPHAAYGSAAEELALYGASVDLLVIGSRGYGPIGRLFHGSTAQKLAHTARCPLLVLTRAATSADREADPASATTAAAAL